MKTRSRSPSLRSTLRRYWPALILLGLAGGASAGLVPMTQEDFYLSGTQIGDIPVGSILTSDNCYGCHGHTRTPEYPYPNWAGSLMGQAGRDPLFYAQMTNANQDVPNVGTYCMRCHVPLAFVTGHAAQPDGTTLDDTDRDGVSCHFCHSMVDPIYKPGVSPKEDEAVLAALESVPQQYGNSMFVLDPSGARRGPFSNGNAPHETIASSFHKSADMCGTCHDVGNVAVSKQPDGTFRYNAIDVPVPDEDPHSQFPLERTYTEWKLSAFAKGGVDMGGRFGGEDGGVVSTCQDCHMPRMKDQRACLYGPKREEVKRHDFAGAAAWVLEIIGLYYRDDPGVNPTLLREGQDKAIAMIEKAASLELRQQARELKVRVINESGHKLPTGHIEGRRVFLNVKFLDSLGRVVKEYGRYDYDTAELDEASTRVYEMKVGLSEDAAALTGLPAGETDHMSLADTIVKDNRIPPRGFDRAAYEEWGAPAVGAAYADGQYWDDVAFAIPDKAARAEVTVFYQIVTRHYIETLANGNVTDHWGDTLEQLWLLTDMAPPTPIVKKTLSISR